MYNEWDSAFPFPEYSMTENNSEIFISHSVAEKLLHAHDGDCTLLFLWQKMTGNTDPETAAGDLCMTRFQTDNAVEKLSRMGLWGSEATVPKPAPVRKPVMPADEPPAYTSEEIVRTVREDKIFCTLRDKMQEVIGKTLTRDELSGLMGIYRHLGLSPETIYVLFQYCADISRSMSGNDRPPTARFIEKTAYTWAHAGISGAEEAEAYAEKQKTLLSEIGKIKITLEIYDRRLTTAETNFITSWLEMGYGQEEIRIAYERTINNTGKLSMPYMNKIILHWSENGLGFASEIEQKDPAERPKAEKRSGYPKRNGQFRKGANSDFDPNEIDSISITKGQ